MERGARAAGDGPARQQASPHDLPWRPRATREADCTRASAEPGHKWYVLVPARQRAQPGWAGPPVCAARTARML
eukprot:826651-Alexandrium_andersonii.AAC.1